MADDDHRPRHLARDDTNRRRGKRPDDDRPGARRPRSAAPDHADQANPSEAEVRATGSAWWTGMAREWGATRDPGPTEPQPAGGNASGTSDDATPWWARASDEGPDRGSPAVGGGDGGRGGADETAPWWARMGDSGADHGSVPRDGRDDSRGTGSTAGAEWRVVAGRDRGPGDRQPAGWVAPTAGTRGAVSGRDRARWVMSEGTGEPGTGGGAPPPPGQTAGDGGDGGDGGNRNGEPGPNGRRDGRPGGPRAASDGGDGPGDDERSLAGGEGGGPPPDRSGRRLPGWLVPALLGVGAVLAGLGAILLDRHETAAPVESAATPVTPVLSARRVPEVIAAPVADRRLTADLQGWIAQSVPNTCLVVQSGERTLYSHNPTAPLAGASTQKIVTAAALLLALGPDARLETAVRASSAPSGGVIAGDLYVVGGGDPLLTSPGYADRMRRDPALAVDPMRLADAIVEAGVTHIEGSVVGDGTRYDGERFHPAWPGRFQGTEVGPVGALTVNDGLAGADGVVQPSVAAAGGDPAANAAAVVTDLLRQRGVTVVGAPRAAPAPSGLTDVATFPSPTVREIVAEMLTDSDDQTAEMAIKELGQRVGGAGTWEAGAAAVTQLLQEAGVALDGVDVVEGSGLATDNRLTCQLLVDLLTLPDTGPVVVEGLAVAGETGTLADRWNGSPVQGRLAGKTGTLNSVTALSGRVTPLQGGALTFAYVTNTPEGAAYSYEPLQHRLGEILVNHPRGVDVATLVPVPPTTGDDAATDDAAAPSSGG